MKIFSEKKQIEYDLTYKSLIGKDIEIIDSNNKNYVGLKGIIVYESANLFHIDVNGEIKKVLKSEIIIKFSYENKNISLDCSLLKGTLTQRIKKFK